MMLLSLVSFINSKKWVIPAVIMYAPSPVFFTAIQSLQVAKPFLPQQVFEALDQFFWSTYQKLVLFFFENYTGVQVELSGDVDEYWHYSNRNENVVVLSNHQCTGRMRYILKDSLKYIPLFGLYFWQHSCVNVGRYGTFSESKTIQQLTYLKEKKLSTWMGIFPEGTRFNPQNRLVIEKSKTYAAANGFPSLDYVLLPRVKATQLALKHMKSHITAVYDVTVAYGVTRLQDRVGEPVCRRVAPGMAEFLNTSSPSVHVHMKRFRAEDIPVEKDELQTWLHKIYKEKDTILARFYQTGSLVKHGEGRTLKSRLSWRETLPSAIICVGATAVVLSHPLGRSLYWKIALGGSIFGMIVMSFQ